MEYMVKHHEFVDVSSGPVYRAVTAWALSAGFDPMHPESFEQQFQSVSLDFSFETGEEVLIVSTQEKRQCFCLNTDQSSLRTPAIDAAISSIGSHPAICQKVDRAIVSLTQNKERIFLDGRDTYRFAAALASHSDGLLVVPFALYLFAQTSVLQERAQARLTAHYAANGDVPSSEKLAEVAAAVVSRNEKDFSRSRGTLLRPEQARSSAYYDLVLDTSTLTPQEVGALVWQSILDKVNQYVFALPVLETLSERTLSLAQTDSFSMT